MSNEISVRLGNVNYACTISDDHHEWIIDEPEEKGGSNRGPDPYTALLASVGSCSAITMRMYAQRKGWEVGDIEIKMSLATQTEGSSRKTVFIRKVLVKGNLDDDQLRRLQHIVNLCPVSKLLEGKITMKTGLVHVPGGQTAIIDSTQENALNDKS